MVLDADRKTLYRHIAESASKVLDGAAAGGLGGVWTSWDLLRQPCNIGGDNDWLEKPEDDAVDAGSVRA
jgi:hypothetical protein